MSEPLAAARLESDAANHVASNATNATYTSTAQAQSDTLGVIENIAIYVLVSVNGTGLVLNVLVFIVLIQLRRRGLLAPMPHLMLGQQAFWDAMSLALAILDTSNSFLLMFDDNNGNVFKAFVCIAIHSRAIYFISFTYSVYNHVLLGLERLFAIMFPLRYPMLKTRFWIVLLVYYTLVAIYTIPAFCRNYYDISQNNCNSTQVHNHKLEPIDVYNVSAVLVYYVIPLLALASCSTAVVLRLRADSSALARLSPHTSGRFGGGGGSGSVSASGGSSKAREASAALVRVSIAQALVFIVCTTFASAFFVLSSLDLIPLLIFSPLGALSILSTNVNMALDPLVYFTFLPALRARLFALFQGRRGQ